MAKNVYFGASFASPFEVEQAVVHGLDSQLLWGSDYPHLEGTFVYPDGRDMPSVTRLALRNTFCDVPPAETRAHGRRERDRRLQPRRRRAAARSPATIDAPTLDELATPIDAVPAEAPASPRSAPAPAAGAERGFGECSVAAACGTPRRRSVGARRSLARGSRGCCPTAPRIRSRTASSSTAVRSIGSTRATACWCHGRTNRSPSPARRMAGEGLDRPRRERLVRTRRGSRPDLLEPRTGLPSGSNRIEPVRADAGRNVLHTCCGTQFTLDRLRPDARLYATAHGIYETFLNGQRVGDSSSRRASRATRPASRPDLRRHRTPRRRRERLGRRAQRRLVPRAHRVRAGARQLRRHRRVPRPARTSATPSSPPRRSWQSSTGAIVARRPHGRTGRGPTARSRRRGTRSPSSTTTVARSRARRHRRCGAWRSCARSTVRPARCPAPGRRPRPEHQRLDPAHRPRPGRAPTLTLVHGEGLDADGDVTQDHLAGGDHVHGRHAAGRPGRHVVSAGREGDVFEPRHTTHGFQYVRIEGHPHRSPPTTSPASSCTPTSAAPAGSGAATSASTASTRSPTGASATTPATIPTDCPQRERAGWTGDWQVFVPTAAFLYDVAGFSLEVAARPRRRAAARRRRCRTSPRIRACRRRPTGGDARRASHGSAGWGDAAVIVPWELSRSTATTACSPSCGRRWCAGSTTPRTSARTNRHRPRVTARPDPAPHEAYLWDTGFHWGEWLEPGAGRRAWDRPTRATWRPPTSTTPPSLVARIGRLLGHDRRGRALRRPRRRRRCGRLAGRVPRRRRVADAGHPGQPRARPRLRPRARRACDRDRRRGSSS